MQTYEMVGVIQRVVVETFTAEVEAENPGEAQDLLYEVLSDYPNSEFKVTKLLKVREEGEVPVSIAIEFQEEELADPRSEITETVFEELPDDNQPA